MIAQAASTRMANWAANLADPPVDKPFQPQRWEAVAEAAVRWARLHTGYVQDFWIAA